MKHLVPFDQLYEYVDYNDVYYVNNRKVKILGSDRRAGNETSFRLMDETGKEHLVTLDNDEIRDYFDPCPEPFVLRRKAAPKAQDEKEAFYNVVVIVGDRVQQVLKSNVPKNRAFGLMNYYKKEANPRGMYPQYRTDMIQVTKCR